MPLIHSLKTCIVPAELSILPEKLMPEPLITLESAKTATLNPFSGSEF